MRVLIVVLASLAGLSQGSFQPAINIETRIRQSRMMVARGPDSTEHVTRQRNETEKKLREQTECINALKKEISDLYSQQRLVKKKECSELERLQQKRNNELKGRDLIRVNNLCGSALTTQGPGSHASHNMVTESGGLQKYGISQGMRNNHLVKAIEQARPDLLSEDNTEQLRRRDQISEKEETLAELEKVRKETEKKFEEECQFVTIQKSKLNDWMRNLSENEAKYAETVRSIAFEKCVTLVTNQILRRAFGRPNRIWDIYHALMADLHFGKDDTFRKKVMESVNSRRPDWGIITPLSDGCLRVASIEQRFSPLLLFDQIGFEMSKMKEIRLMNFNHIDHSVTWACYILDIQGTNDVPLCLDGFKFHSQRNAIIQREGSVTLEQLRDLIETLREEARKQESIPDDWKFDEDVKLMRELINKHPSNSAVRDDKHELVLRDTEKNPADCAEFHQIYAKTTCNDDDYLRIHEMYIDCGCEISAASWALAYDLIRMRFNNREYTMVVEMIRGLRAHEKTQSIFDINFPVRGKWFIYISVQFLNSMMKTDEFEQNTALEMIVRLGQDLCHLYEESDYIHYHLRPMLVKYFVRTDQDDLAMEEYVQIEDATKMDQSWQDYIREFEKKFSKSELRKARQNWKNRKESETDKRKRSAIGITLKSRRVKNGDSDPVMIAAIQSEFKEEIKKWKHCQMDHTHHKWMADLIAEKDSFAKWVDQRKQPKTKGKAGKKHKTMTKP